MKPKRELHGMVNTPEHSSWRHMKSRCNNKNNIGYKNYGGRGITVCDRWQNSFLLFFKDMGLKPFPRAQIDRIDNNGNYEPNNCRWVSNLENSQNRRTNVLNWFTVRSIRRLYAMHKYTTKQLCLIYNLKYRAMQSVIYNTGWREV